MKNTVLTIALGLASLPLTFAAQTAPAPANQTPAAPAAKTATVKKHHKAVKKNVKPAAKTPAAPAAAPAK